METKIQIFNALWIGGVLGHAGAYYIFNGVDSFLYLVAVSIAISFAFFTAKDEPHLFRL